MIKIEYDILLPKNCDECPLADDETMYCHGHLNYEPYEIQDNLFFYKMKNKQRPNWCPLKEVKNET